MKRAGFTPAFFIPQVATISLLTYLISRISVQNAWLEGGYLICLFRLIILTLQSRKLGAVQFLFPLQVYESGNQCFIIQITATGFKSN